MDPQSVQALKSYKAHVARDGVVAEEETEVSMSEKGHSHYHSASSVFQISAAWRIKCGRPSLTQGWGVPIVLGKPYTDSWVSWGESS